MEANNYQNLAWQTAKPFYKVNNTSDSTFKQLQITCAALALAGEAGELANKLKKIVESGQGIDHDALNLLIEELGDVQWYVAHFATMLDVRLEDIMGLNISKLRERYKNVLSNR